MEDLKKDAEDNKIMGILAYLGILVIIPILAAKESKFARYHSNQGLILIIVAICCSIAFTILGMILTAISFALGIIVTLLNLVLSIGVLVLMVIGIMNVVKGEMKELPIIGKYTILK
jgi:uncharacterized membrane protein